jgi:dienelactone hydrolase
MSSNPPSKCCISGFQHDGKATGIYQDIGGYECYVASSVTKDTKRAILLLTDVLGHRFLNVQLIADRFAANGYFTVVPDLFHGMFILDIHLNYC